MAFMNLWEFDKNQFLEVAPALGAAPTVFAAFFGSLVLEIHRKPFPPRIDDQRGLNDGGDEMMATQ